MEYLQYKDRHWWIHRVFRVLNLVISGIPSIRIGDPCMGLTYNVLNLVISGIPSILYLAVKEDREVLVF